MNERFGIATLLQQIRNVDEATGLSEVSGDVCPGDLFVACSQNKKQREQHIAEATQAGAVGLIIDEQASVPTRFAARHSGADLAARRGMLASQFMGTPPLISNASVLPAQMARPLSPTMSVILRIF